MERQELINRFQKWLDTKPRDQIIAAQCTTIAIDYHNEQLLLLGVVKSVKEKKLPKIEDYVTDYFYKLKGNQYLKKEDCTSWTIERIIEDYHRQIALQL